MIGVLVAPGTLRGRQRVSIAASGWASGVYAGVPWLRDGGAE